jgi:abequosyltransferase
MNKIKLSFCITTFNHEEFISATLESIVSQYAKDIEIIIGDSSSNNKTEIITKKFSKKFQNIVYKRLNNEGFGVDLSKTIAFAKGEYCWLFSSDDCVKKGAIDYIKNLITLSNASVLLCNRTICSKDLVPSKDSPNWLLGDDNTRKYYFNDPDEVNNYIIKSQSIGSLFSYMSSVIFKKDKWDKIPIKTHYMTNNYQHVWRVLQILKEKNSSLYYTDKQIVLFRGDNDSFTRDGYPARIYLDFDGYKNIINYYFKDKKIITSFKKLMQREHPFYSSLIRLRSELKSKKDWKEFERKLIYYGYHPLQIHLINFIGSNKFAVLFLRKIKKTINYYKN